jgi:hypothetical protein
MNEQLAQLIESLLRENLATPLKPRDVTVVHKDLTQESAGGIYRSHATSVVITRAKSAEAKPGELEIAVGAAEIAPRCLEVTAQADGSWKIDNRGARLVDISPACNPKTKAEELPGGESVSRSQGFWVRIGRHQFIFSWTGDVSVKVAVTGVSIEPGTVDESVEPVTYPIGEYQAELRVPGGIGLAAKGWPEILDEAFQKIKEFLRQGSLAIEERVRESRKNTFDVRAQVDGVERKFQISYTGELLSYLRKQPYGQKVKGTESGVRRNVSDTALVRLELDVKLGSLKRLRPGWVLMLKRGMIPFLHYLGKNWEFTLPVLEEHLNRGKLVLSWSRRAMENSKQAQHDEQTEEPFNLDHLLLPVWIVLPAGTFSVADLEARIDKNKPFDLELKEDTDVKIAVQARLLWKGKLVKIDQGWGVKIEEWIDERA